MESMKVSSGRCDSQTESTPDSIADSKVYLKRGDQAETIKINGRELYIGEVEDWVDAILHGKPPRIGLGDSRGNVATILALLESARSGKPIQLD